MCWHAESDDVVIIAEGLEVLLQVAAVSIQYQQPLAPHGLVDCVLLKVLYPVKTMCKTGPSHNQLEAEQQLAYTVQKVIERLSNSPDSVIEALNRSHRGHQRTATELTLMRAELHSVKKELLKLNKRRERYKNRFKSDQPSLSQADLEARIPAGVNLRAPYPITAGGSPPRYPSGRAMPQCSNCRMEGHRRDRCPRRQQAPELHPLPFTDI